MAKVITCVFFESGVPKTGLSPTITVYKVSDGSTVVSAQAMTELAGGFYKYSYAGYDGTEQYVFSADSVTLTGSERYSVGPLDENILTDLSARIPAALSSGNIKADALAISTSTAAADKLEASAETIVVGTVSWDNTNATTTVFYSDDITEATADHYNGRIVIFTTGDLIYQATNITDYALDTGEGKFTVTALTEAPADNVTFVIV